MSNDRSYLTALQDYYARHRALPSYASIGSLLGLRSKSSVAALVARLKLRGLVESTPDRRLAPTRRFFERPLADAPVRAGLPNPIDDAPADALTIDDYLIEHPSRTVLVRVKGDSMQEAGIFDGDLAVVEKRNTARRGEIVIAIVDADDPYFGHPVRHCRGTGGFQVDERDRRGEHGDLTDERSFASLHLCRTIVPT